MNRRKKRQYVFNPICMASIAVAVLCVLMPLPTFADDSAQTEQTRVTESGQALDALVNSQNGIPTDLLNKSECVIICPLSRKEVSSLPANMVRA